MADKALAIRDNMTLSELGSVFVRSGFFTDSRDASQAIVKILAGRELGFGAIASMTGVYIVKGRVSLSANLMAAAVKRTNKYNYRIVEHTEQVCELAFFEGGQEVGRSRFTIADAKKAGTQNIDKFPRNMLFARAMSNGVKWFTPDVFAGPVYTPDEMGATVDESGEVIDGITGEITRPNGNGHKAEPVVEIVAHPDAPEPVALLLDNQEPEPAAFKPAAIKGLTHANEWLAGAKAIAAKYPSYQTVIKGKPNGQPNMFHILGAAAKCGYETVNDGNFELVLEAIDKRAGAVEQAAMEELAS